MTSESKKPASDHDAHDPSAMNERQTGLQNLEAKQTTPSDNGKSALESALSSARDLAFVLSIFLIFTGVVFRSAYFQSFGLPTSLADDSLYLILLEAYRVIMEHARPVLGLTFAAIAFLGVVSLFCARQQVSPRTTRIVESLIAGVFVAMAFPSLAVIATDSATRQADLVRSGGLIGATVHVNANRDAHFPIAELQDSASISIIGQTPSSMFVLYQPQPTKQNPNVLPDGQVFSIPNSDIDFVAYELTAEEKSK